MLLSPLLRGRSLAAAIVTFGLLVAPAVTAERAMPAKPAADKYRWLESVLGKRALAWVASRNAESQAELGKTPQLGQLEAAILAILDSDAKIPFVEKLGAHYYNFWRDAQHERGLYRRTSLEEYRKPSPRWETVIDLDALSRDEKDWVFHGISCLKPEYRRCLVTLSRGGADADVTREFDLVDKRWVEGGFFRKESKGGLAWIDAQNVFAFTDFGPGSMTASGYPRIVKHWRRGTPIEQAKLVYAGQPGDVSIGAFAELAPGFERQFVRRAIAFYEDELFVRGPDGKLSKLDVPNTASKAVHHQWLLLELRDAWTTGGRSYEPGSLLVARLDDLLKGQPSFERLFAPSDTTALSGYAFTRDHLVLSVLDDVKSRLWLLTPGASGFSKRELPSGSGLDTISASEVDADDSNAVWLTSTNYLTPTRLSRLELGGAAEPLKTMPAFFDASKHTVEQQFAKSEDGTRVPYFIVRPRDLPLDGSRPTLLYGYGGFEVSLTPAYSGSVGKGWLERGGVYVVANIRGGGEYGPRWHKAALKEQRHRAYDDFAAVARDLIARKITSPKRLGIQGGSNGGLLMGNMLVHHPELFGAVVLQVPLLDMRRYHKLLAGASWMAEYGDPDKPSDWRFIEGFSPYHQVRAGAAYPPALFMTSTRDDRVHPGHARKMMAKLSELGYDVRYYENVEGGHGGSATNKQAAHMSALAYTFLWQRLSR